MSNSKKLKIGLFPLHSFFKPGGVKSHVLALHKEFKKRGLNSKIIVPERDPAENYGRNIKLFGTSFPFPFNGAESDLTVCFTPGSIDKLLEKEKFDILHFHNFGLHSWQILEKSKGIPAPYMALIPDIAKDFIKDIFGEGEKKLKNLERGVHPHTKRAHTPYFGGKGTSARYGVGVNILTFHACINPTTSRFFKVFPFILQIFKKSVNEKMDGIIGIAPFNLELFKDFKGSTAVIPNGIDLEEFHPRVPKIRKYSDGKINILFLGRLEERKGLMYLLKAYQILKNKFSNLRLIVVGEGELRSECQGWVKTHRLKDVIFEGRIEGKKLPSYYTSCDIFVAPAIFGESFGIVLLEAMASKTPVAAFANRGYKRVLKGRGKEFLVKPKDWRGLAKKIEILIKNKKKRKEMAEWGLREAQKYSWPEITDRVLDFYNKVMKSKKSTSRIYEKNP